MTLEILPEERETREIERIGDLLDRHGRFLQLCLCLHDNHARDDLATGLSRYVLDGRAQVRGRDAHLLGIKGHVALMRIMLQYQFAKGLADLLSCPQGRHRVLLTHTDLTYSFQDQVNLIFNQLTVVQLSTLETDQQQLQISPIWYGSARCCWAGS